MLAFCGSAMVEEKWIKTRNFAPGLQNVYQRQHIPCVLSPPGLSAQMEMDGNGYNRINTAGKDETIWNHQPSSHRQWAGELFSQLLRQSLCQKFGASASHVPRLSWLHDPCLPSTTMKYPCSWATHQRLQKGCMVVVNAHIWTPGVLPSQG